MKYIDAEKLIAEIERLKNQTERRLDNIVPIRRKDTMDEEQLAKIELRDKVDKAYLNGVLITLGDILSFINSLQQEQPEVDFEEEWDKFEDWMESYNRGDYPTCYSPKQIARHFFELGLSAGMEKSNGVDGVVHHALKSHWIVTDKNKLAAILKAFPEGAEVELFICAKKEK